MTVTITITDPTADESRAVRAYLDSLHGSTAGYVTGDRGPEIIHPTPAEQVATTRFEEQIEVPVATAPDFDSAGMPWDERIHASSRATVADGTWRKKRGVSPEEVAAVEAELATVREQSATEAPSAPEQEVPEVPVGEPASAPVADAPSPSPDSVDGVGGSDAPPPPPAATPNPFLAVMSRIGKSKLDKAKKDELLTAAGALDEKGNPSILVLNKRPELIDGFVALLDSEGV